MVNIGIVGLGFMGVTHLQAYQKIASARLAAVCDSVRLPEDGNLAGIAGNIATTSQIHLDMTQVKGYRNYEDMLANPEVQLVDICVPTPLHAPIAKAALAAGKHVICEKPLARTSQTCREIVEAAKSARGFFMPAMCIRFWPEWAWAKDAIADNRFGKVLAARFRRVSQPPGWSQGSYFKGDESGGALLDLHIHDVDFIQYCFGRPLSVFSSGATRFSGAIDHVVSQYQVESGAVVSAEGSWVMTPGFGFNMSYTIIFEKATLDYDGGRGKEALKLFEEGKDPRVVECTPGDGYEGELRHMIQSIESGTAPTLIRPEDGLTAVEICEAEEASVKSGSVIRLRAC